MPGFLPLLALAAAIYSRRSGPDWRAAFLEGAVIWGMTLVAITEGLSAFERLGRSEVAITWIVFVVAVVAIIRWRRRVPAPYATLRAQPGDLPQAVAESETDSLARAQLATIAVLLLIALVLALAAAPAASDSMTYHLPRVEHWIQNSSVGPFRSNIQRELWPDPGAEYIFLHFEILSRSDRAVTLVQWSAYAGTIVLASLIARQLGATRRGQSFAAFLAATIPGAVAQATGSQVELVFAFWLTCAVSLGLRTRKTGETIRLPGESALLGGAIGLAVLTKAITYLYFAPFFLWFLVSSIRREGTKALRLWLVAGLVAIAINAAHSYYNVVIYGGPLGQPGANGVVNSSFFVGGTVSNVVRNLSLHFGTPFATVNSAAESVVIAFDKTLGITPDDERTTFPRERYHFNARQSAEQTAGSPIHVIIALGVFLFLVWHARRRHGETLAYMSCVAGGFLLFCFYLRWQPWNARLHVPLLILATPASALVLDRMRQRVFVWAASGLALASALPPLLRNPAHPLIAATPVFSIPREKQYFAESLSLYPSYKAAADQLEKLDCRDIGLWLPGDGVEYPLWALLKGRLGNDVRIRHVSVDNPSVNLRRTPAGDNFTACALVLIESEGRYKPVVIPEGYDLTWKQGVIRIYTPSAGH